MGERTISDSAREYAEAREHAALFEVSSRGKIEVAGPDADTFLHNLSTNDIKNLPIGAGCEAFFATVKARVVAHGWIYRAEASPPALWLDVDASRVATVMTHLDRHLISEQVELTDHTSKFAQFHLTGPQAPAIAGQVFGQRAAELAPLHHVAMIQKGVTSVRRRDWLGLPGFDILAKPEEERKLSQELTSAGVTPAGLDTFEALRIEAGLPLDGADMDENRFVVEVGRTQAISYTKGCYLGQEPIVMARDRGHVNRLLLGVKLHCGSVASGAKLFRDGQEVGVVTSSTFSPVLGTAIGLAYIRRGSQEPGSVLQVEAPDGQVEAIVSALPFPFAGPS